MGTRRAGPGPVTGAVPAVTGAVPAVTAAAVTGIAGLLLGLDQLHVIAPPTPVLVTAVTATAVVGFGVSVAGALAPARAVRLAEMTEALDFLLRTLAFTVQDLTDLDVRELGLAVYVRRRNRLQRVARDRASRRPTASGVVWRPGMGVVGACVDSGAEVGQDVEVDTAGWASVGERDWPDLPADVRAGFDWAQSRALLGKYPVVIASPILGGAQTAGGVLGCLALDGPSGSYDLLWTPDVRSALADAAETVRRFVW